MRVVVTGGAGFIGCNLAHRLARRGHDVAVVDDLSRAGSDRNLRSLTADPELRDRIAFHRVDVRDAAGLAAVLAGGGRPADAVVHLAGQTTVTESVTDPVTDFDVNARGTLVLLEAVRGHAPGAHVLFSSTNKVYGDLRSLRTERAATRYALPDHPGGITEAFPTNAASPYGCSKLAADAYVRDYGATYGLATTVLRTSCVYGRWQNGMVGQGWVSWFVRNALLGNEITIYGDGLQVRDLLHVDDLVDAYVMLVEGRRGTGEVFNIGGGPDHALSVWAEFGTLLEELVRSPIKVRYEPRRVADQDVYVSDCGKLATELGWRPARPPADGIAELVRWTGRQLAEERGLELDPR